MQEHILVAGATGLVGFAAMKHFAERGYKVTALSRRKPFETFGAAHLPLDLTDRAACAEALSGMSDVTRLVYAALYEKPGLVAGWREADQIETNRRMLENLFDPLEKAAPRLRHVSLLQGTKAYGAHVRPLSVPARENRDEMKEQPNFYWDQEEYLRAKQQGRAWHWTIFRPQIIFGFSLGAAMNLIPAIGVYGALLKEEGEPLAYPGGASSVLEAVDADLLADAIAWTGVRDRQENAIFNVTNGDVFVWKNVWPAIADALGMKPGEMAPMSLGAEMPKRATAWDAIRRKYDLAAPDMASFVGESFHYADFTMAYGAERDTPAAIVSTIALRRAGFHEVIDTEEMFRKYFRLFQDKRLLPPR
ncbi:MAG: SDR family oxidoreductase [Alphaproteobacteria bacterium]|nr:SDR family oxidoreductase [Alphaproteobacteria bacterium]MDX5416374.1 SDR family oxidoreductase [Alphaproteobacteria bacterium]MDX5493723.1 SDR family oxidoreductase [Alphaproteobacteria bacterium]